MFTTGITTFAWACGTGTLVAFVLLTSAQGDPGLHSQPGVQDPVTESVPAGHHADGVHSQAGPGLRVSRNRREVHGRHVRSLPNPQLRCPCMLMSSESP